MLWTIFMISIAVWMMGLVFHFGGSVLHLMLVVAVIVLVMDHMFRRRSFRLK